jgi:hypothetical protein
MEIQKRQARSLRRQVKPAELVNYNAVKHYVDTVGTPYCRCCGDITFKCIFMRVRGTWYPYCINCGVTRQQVGVCLHGNVKIIIVKVKE